MKLTEDKKQIEASIKNYVLSKNIKCMQCFVNSCKCTEIVFWCYANCKIYGHTCSLGF